MKKIVNTMLLVTIVITAFAFTVPNKKKVSITESTIIWKGKKVIGSSHNGTINLKEGYFEFENDALVGGHFEIDMTSISNNDLEGKYKTKLEGHLKSDDFFSVEKFPTASFKINEVKKSDGSYNITGDMTIKGITNSVSFDMNMKGNTSTANIEFDRSKFDVRYGSGSFFDNLGDKTISDIIELNITLKH
jgi:polyisoprenoid-binding protein YceI